MTVAETAATATAGPAATSEEASQATQPAPPLLVVPPRHMNQADLQGVRSSQRSRSSVAQQLSLLTQLKDDADTLVRAMSAGDAAGPSPTCSGPAGPTPREPPPRPPAATQNAHTYGATSGRSRGCCGGGAIAALREADRGARAAYLGSRCRQVLVSASVAAAWHDIDARGAFLASGGGGVVVGGGGGGVSVVGGGGGLGLGPTAAEAARMEAAARNPSRATLQSVYRLQQLQRLQQEGVALVAQMGS
ncbi:MAG: hypothetical protein WDW38_010918 [Sanguina aurantia]